MLFAVKADAPGKEDVVVFWKEEVGGASAAGVGVAVGDDREGGRRRRARMAWRGGRMSKVEGGGREGGGGEVVVGCGIVGFEWIELIAGAMTVGMGTYW